jgi:hypothetical protein
MSAMTITLRADIDREYRVGLKFEKAPAVWE